MEYQQLVNAIALSVIREAYPVGDENDPSLNLNALIRSREKKEAQEKNLAPEKQETKEAKETTNKPLQPISPNKLAEQGREDYLKHLHKKVSNYI